MSIESRIEALEARLDKIEKNVVDRFNKLDELMTQGSTIFEHCSAQLKQIDEELAKEREKKNPGIRMINWCIKVVVGMKNAFFNLR